MQCRGEAERGTSPIINQRIRIGLLIIQFYPLVALRWRIATSIKASSGGEFSMFSLRALVGASVAVYALLQLYIIYDLVKTALENAIFVYILLSEIINVELAEIVLFVVRRAVFAHVAACMLFFFVMTFNNFYR